jgi:rhamnosyltransferase
VRISVALAVRNAERYLPALLASLRRQTLAPHELVVSDDASDDTTPGLLAAFAASVPFPVRVERFDTWRGHVEGFMHAAGRCEGDAIAFCDGDDVWVDGKLERCARELEGAGATLVLHTTQVVDAELRDLGRRWPVLDGTRVAPPLALTGLELHAPGMAMTFRRELLTAADFDARPPSRYGNDRPMLHDEWVFFLAGVLGPIALVDEPLVLYRQHDSNDSGGWLEHRRGLTLQPVVENYRSAAAHTAACAEYLRATRSADPEVAERLTAGERAFRAAAENWALRASLYGTAGRRSRARMLRRLVAGGAYRARSAGGFGRIALGKDLAAGLALRVDAS